MTNIPNDTFKSYTNIFKPHLSLTAPDQPCPNNSHVATVGRQVAHPQWPDNVLTKAGA